MPRSRSAKASQPLPDPSKQEEVLSGLYLFGTIIDRTRRIINTKSNNSTAEIVTYTI